MSFNLELRRKFKCLTVVSLDEMLVIINSVVNINTSSSKNEPKQILNIYVLLAVESFITNDNLPLTNKWKGIRAGNN